MFKKIILLISLLCVVACIYLVSIYFSMSIDFDEDKFYITEDQLFFELDPIVEVHGGDLDPYKLISKKYSPGTYEITYTIRNGFIHESIVKKLVVKGS